MRFFIALFSVLTVFFFASSAMAQSTDIQWKDLSARERQGILNQWRALPQAEKGPFIRYSTQAIEGLSEEKKAQYDDIAEERAEKEKKLHAAYEKRQAEEKKSRAIAEKPKPAAIEVPAPIVNKISDPAAIAPSASIDMEKAAPIEAITPAVEGQPTEEKSSESASDKAKKMMDKFF